LRENTTRNYNPLFGNFGLVRVNNILSEQGKTPQTNPVDAVHAVANRSRRTLMMMTSVDWNNDGFALGSSTVELDWND
jgi:hypothetical protein